MAFTAIRTWSLSHRGSDDPVKMKKERKNAVTPPWKLRRFCFFFRMPRRSQSWLVSVAGCRASSALRDQAGMRESA
jgi:hypothetical protein